MENEIKKVDQFAIARAEDVSGVIERNLGGEPLTPHDLPTVKVPGGAATAWTVPSSSGDQSTPDLIGVIVFTKLTRAWYEQSFDESGGGVPPDCSADDGLHGVGVHAESCGGICARCKHAQWGSSRDGRGGQDCQTRRPLFICRESDMLPIMVAIPAGSMKTAKKYLTSLAFEGYDYHAVLSRLTLAEARSRHGNIRYSQVQFENLGVLPDKAKKRFGDVRQKLTPMLSSMRSVDVEAAASTPDA